MKSKIISLAIWSVLFISSFVMIFCFSFYKEDDREIVESAELINITKIYEEYNEIGYEITVRANLASFAKGTYSFNFELFTKDAEDNAISFGVHNKNVDKFAGNYVEFTVEYTDWPAYEEYTFESFEEVRSESFKKTSVKPENLQIAGLSMIPISIFTAYFVVDGIVKIVKNKKEN